MLVIMLRCFDILTPRHLNHLVLQSFDDQCTRWMLLKIRLVYAKLDIYVFITNYLRQIQIRVYLNISSNELYTKKQIRIQMYSLFLI